MFALLPLLHPAIPRAQATLQPGSRFNQDELSPFQLIPLFTGGALVVDVQPSGVVSNQPGANITVRVCRMRSIVEVCGNGGH